MLTGHESICFSLHPFDPSQRLALLQELEIALGFDVFQTIETIWCLDRRAEVELALFSFAQSSDLVHAFLDRSATAQRAEGVGEVDVDVVEFALDMVIDPEL